MNEERLGSPAAFAEQLFAHLSATVDAPGGLPDARDLERLVTLAFFASLREEEARRSQFTLVWTGGVHRCIASMALYPPVPATATSIAKVAPVAQREATSLAIRRDGDELVIWALMQHGTPTDLPLMLCSLAPGVLRVDYGGVPRALYARGEVIFLGTPDAVISPAKRLTEAFKSWSEDARRSNGIDARAEALTRIAAQSLHHGHGGMILIIGKGSEPRGVRMHYKAGEGADILTNRYSALVPGTDLAHQQRFNDAIDFVASLTATDNAVLLDTDLRVHGFGVQVIEGETPLRSFSHVNPYSRDVHTDDISTFKGTRHPAGVIFCLRQEREAGALIASQDGRLSLVTKDANGVVEVLGSYEHAFGWR